MTDAQRDTLDKVRLLMDEHFDGWVLAFTTEADDKTDVVDVRWHGGYAVTLGLLTYSIDEVIHRQRAKHDL